MNTKRLSLLILATIPILFMFVTPTYAQSGFIASSTNSTLSTKPTDPNYNTYQNLALGFGIKYIKNMTILQRDNKLTSGGTVHIISFHAPHMGSVNFTGIPHLIGVAIVVTPSTGAFGIQQGLDEDVKTILMNFLADNLTTVISKSKGSLNLLPAYRIEYETMVNPVNYTGTTAKIPSHIITYLTVKNQIL